MPKEDQTAPAAPNATASDPTTVTVNNPDPTQEYSIDGTTWVKPDQNGEVVFENQEPGSVVHVVTRKAGDDQHNPSPASPAADVTMPKADQPAPEPTEDAKVEPNPRSITIDPTVPGNQYIVVPKDTVPTENDWADNGKTSDHGEPLTFDNLTPGQKYDIISRTPGDDQHNVSPNSERTPISTPKENQANNPDKPVVIVEETTPVSAVIRAEQDEEYVIVPKNTVPTANDWNNAKRPQGNNTVTFDNLTPKTEYDVFSRKVETATQKPSGPSQPAPLTTTTGSIAWIAPQIGAILPQITVEGLLEEEDMLTLCDAQENHDILYGEHATIYLKISNITATASENDKYLCTTAVKAKNADGVVGLYMDLSLFKKVGNNAEQKLFDTNGKKIKITVTVPEDLRPTDNDVVRTYYLIRIHNGRAQILATTVSPNYTFSFETDLFSTYAIGYADKKTVQSTTTTTSVRTGTKPTVKAPNAKVIGPTEITVQPTVAGEEYSIDGGKTWIKPEKGSDSVSFENLTPGKIYNVIGRKAATGTTRPSDPGPATNLRTPKLDQDAPQSVPNARADGPNSIVVEPTVPGEEYSIDGGKTWVKPAPGENRVVFDNLTPGTEYEVISRKAETESANPSGSSPAAVVKTDEEEKPTPVPEKIIEDKPVPTVQAQPGWALLNLLLTLAAIFVALWVLLKKRDEDEARSKKTIRLIGLLPALATVVTFMLTQDLSKPMQIVDKWTILMTAFLAIVAVTSFLTRSKKAEDAPKA